jgi:hypothetical protein
MLIRVSLVAFAAAARLSAQAIDPGMTREQVVAKLGEPLSSRPFESFTYLLYRNGCEKTCGMNDLVVLDSGKVVDAVFRDPKRKYTGTSSSPRMISPREATRGPAAAATPLRKPRPVKKPVS